MSASGQDSKPFVSPTILFGLVIVSMLSLVAYFALSAYAPDFRNESDGQAHALSNSAIGYAGLRVLLDASGIPSTINRGSLTRRDRHPSLIVLTPPVGADDDQALRVAVAGNLPGPGLIILPKWVPLPDPTAYGRVVKSEPFDPGSIATVLRSFSAKTRIKQRKKFSLPHVRRVAGFDFADANPGAIDAFQTMSGPKWIPLLADAEGGVVLARYKNGWVYVLADPDLVNTHGVHDLPTAAFAIALIQHLRSGNGPVEFDVTLNGLGRSPNLLRQAFAPPFLGATLCAILAALLIGFHAVARFGSPPAETPVYARGKEALVANAADLIRMLRREPNMAQRYAITTRNLVLAALGVRRQLEDQESADFLKALERGDRTTYSALRTAADHVHDRSDLVALARKLYEWRQEMLHGR